MEGWFVDVVGFDGFEVGFDGRGFFGWHDYPQEKTIVPLLSKGIRSNGERGYFPLVGWIFWTNFFVESGAPVLSTNRQKICLAQRICWQILLRLGQDVLRVEIRLPTPRRCIQIHNFTRPHPPLTPNNHLTIPFPTHSPGLKPSNPCLRVNQHPPTPASNQAAKADLEVINIQPYIQTLPAQPLTLRPVNFRKVISSAAPTPERRNSEPSGKRGGTGDIGNSPKAWSAPERKKIRGRFRGERGGIRRN